MNFHLFTHILTSFYVFFFSLHSLGSRVGSGAEGRVTPKLKVSHLYEDGFGKNRILAAFENRKDSFAELACPFV